MREKHQVTISELQAEIRRLKEELKVGGRGEVVKQREPERGVSWCVSLFCTSSSMPVVAISLASPGNEATISNGS